MKYSDKLNGYWEEGYHYYLEIRDAHMTVRDYKREVMLETEISYDADAVERGDRAVITPEDNVLSRDGYGEPFTMIRELAYEEGELKFLYYYTIMGETLYTLKKVDRGPFDYITIVDDEVLDSIQGEWFMWRPDGEAGERLRISDNFLSVFGVKSEFHAVRYEYNHDQTFLVPANLTSSDFGVLTKIEVCPNMLTATIIVMDMDMPLSVFARKDMLDKIEVPGDARRIPRCTMGPAAMYDSPVPSMGDPGFFGMMMMDKAMNTTPVEAPEFTPVEPDADGNYSCPECKEKFGDVCPNFCPNCGARLK